MATLSEHRHHWKARAVLKREYEEIFVAEIISISGGLLAGTLLAFYINQILLIPGLLILLPGFLELRGNVSGALAARLGTALDLKRMKPRLAGNKIVDQNIIASFIEVLVVSLVLAAVAYAVTYFIFGAATPKIFLIAIIAALVSNLIEVVATTFAVFAIYKAGHDPNNIMGPYVTTTGDVISVLSLLFAIVVVSWI
jgi:mgtE-like transporter